MMRFLVVIILLSFSSLMFAGEGKYRKSLEVQILSDEFDSKVPAGKCKVTGEVYFQGKLVKDAEVCSYKGKECVLTDKKGEFSIIIDTSEINVYASIIGAKTSYLGNYSFKSQHHLKLRFYIEEKYSTVRKPVIYMYSDKEVELGLSLNTEVELSFTYPAYNEGWKVSLSPEKGLSVESKEYPYLFWEGKDYGNLKYTVTNGQIVGEVIHTDTVINYLEKQLKAYGLNQSESTDFITFWGPILSKEKYALVQFLVDEDYDQIASIQTSMAINNERRVFLMYQSFSMEPSIEVTKTQPAVKSIERNGVTLIEWGGAEVIIPNL